MSASKLAKLYKYLNEYLALRETLPSGCPDRNEHRVWLDSRGRAHGRYFSCTLTTAFQPIRALEDHRVMAVEAFARSAAGGDSELALWKLLDNAVNDDESVALDRLCRLLHVLNFAHETDRQVDDYNTLANADLFLNVHPRLLDAVESSHGTAFRHMLDVLDFSSDKIVLQLPAVSSHQRWLLHAVVGSYRRNGFRFAVNATSVEDALSLLGRVQPDFIKVACRRPGDSEQAEKLLTQAGRRGIGIIFKKIEDPETFDWLLCLNANTYACHVQGYLMDLPSASINATQFSRLTALPETHIQAA